MYCSLIWVLNSLLNQLNLQWILHPNKHAQCISFYPVICIFVKGHQKLSVFRVKRSKVKHLLNIFENNTWYRNKIRTVAYFQRFQFLQYQKVYIVKKCPVFVCSRLCSLQLDGSESFRLLKLTWFTMKSLTH